MKLLQTLIPGADAVVDTNVKVKGELATIDSIHKAISDSLANITTLEDLGAVVTGQNPLIKNAMASLLDLTVRFIPKLLVALFVWWLGWKLVKLLCKGMKKMFEKREVDPSLHTFLISIVNILLKVLIFLVVIGIVGIQATSFIAILGAFGLAIGMALQGTLQNFAGGVIILLMKPFKVGDYIEAENYAGYVRDIRIFHTMVEPFNGRMVIIPNSELATKSLINHTKQDYIRLSAEVGVAYGTNPAKVKEVLWDVVHSYENTVSDADKKPLVLKEPKQSAIYLTKLGDSSVNYTVWMWCTIDNYWTVWGKMYEDFYNALYAANIPIPFPQMDVHLDK